MAKRNCRTCACNRVCAVMYRMGGFCSDWQPQVILCINCVNWDPGNKWCKTPKICRDACQFCSDGLRKNEKQRGS